MFSFKFLLLSTTFFLYSSAALFAQNTAVLTYPEALRTGTQQNINLKTEYNQYQSATAYKANAFYNYLPPVSISSTGLPEVSDGKQFDPISGTLFTQHITRASIMGSVNLTLFNGFEKHNSLMQANNYLKAQKEKIEETRLNLFGTITKLYLQLLLNQEVLKTQKSNYEIQKEQLQYIESQVELGIKTINDVYTQRVELKKAELNLLEVENQFRSDKMELSNVLQLKLHDSIGFTMPKFIPVFPSYDPDSLYEIALKNRPDLKKLIELNEASRRSLKISRAKLYPNVTAFVYYGSGYSSLIEQNFNSQFFNLNPFYRRGISINIPITNALHYRYPIVSAKIQYLNSSLEVQQMKVNIYNQIQTFALNINNARKTVEVSRAEYEAASHAIETARERYQLGLISFLETAIINRNFIQASADKTRADVNIVFQELMLANYCGLLDITNIK